MIKTLAKKKIKAVALYYTLLISLVITLVLFGIIAMNYLDRKIVTIDIRQQRLADNISSAATLLGLNHEWLATDSTTLDLFDDGADKVKVDIVQWGAFKVARFKAEWKFLTDRKACMYGAEIPPADRVGLYMADQNRYLSVSGNTRLSGRTYLPALGIRRAHIEGSGYRGDELVYGKTKESEKTLPALNNRFMESHRPYMSLDSAAFDTILDYQQTVNESRNLSNSFLNKTWVLTSPNDIYLDRVSLEGNIVVASQNAVVVTQNTKLENVMLYGKQIYFLKNFKGSCQAFAADSLFIDEGCELYYPSCVGLINREGTVTTCQIEDNVLIEGGLILQQEKESTNDVQVRIREHTRIRGTVYCNGQLQLDGEILGSLYIKQFVLKTRRAYYENHLLDGQVDPVNLSSYFLFGYLLGETERSDIICWLPE